MVDSSIGDETDGSGTGTEEDGRAGGRGRPSEDYTGPGSGAGGLAQRLGELARLLEGEEDLQETLDAIVAQAVATVPGAEQASICAVRRRREVVTRASTGELPRAVDQAQYETGQGPCLDSLHTQRTVRLSDLAADRRWPVFTGRAAGLGLGSMLAVQLYVDGADLGALNLHSRQPGAFDDDSEQVALLFASHAAVAVAGAQTQDQMRRALGSRDLIGQAQGILMERFKITGATAFQVLARASQRENRKLAEVAEELVASRELPRALRDDPPQAGLTAVPAQGGHPGAPARGGAPVSACGDGPEVPTAGAADDRS